LTQVCLEKLETIYYNVSTYEDFFEHPDFMDAATKTRLHNRVINQYYIFYNQNEGVGRELQMTLREIQQLQENLTARRINSSVERRQNNFPRQQQHDNLEDRAQLAGAEAQPRELLAQRPIHRRERRLRVNPEEPIVDGHQTYVFVGAANSNERREQLNEIVQEFEESERNHIFTNVIVTRPGNTNIGNANYRNWFLNARKGLDVVRSAVAHAGAVGRFEQLNEEEREEYLRVRISEDIEESIWYAGQILKNLKTHFTI
jgi:hypothetical protein